MSTELYPILGLVVLSLGLGIIGVSSSINLYSHKIAEDPELNSRCLRQRLFLTRVRSMLWILVLLLVGGTLSMYAKEISSENSNLAKTREKLFPVYDKEKIWQAPNVFLAETDPDADLIQYGRDLIARTQDYFGEHGIVRPSSINSLNCQNCHLDAGTKAFGNNYSAVQSIYPKIRGRSGQLETIPKRINDCFERSLNGQPLDTTSHEMKAMVAYMQWLGTGIPKGESPKGKGLVDLPLLDRAADPVLGKAVYDRQCASCHGSDGQGLVIPGSPRSYPPLWGAGSYNQAAGLFRLSRFASYVKANMPFGATYENPQLSDEEAWDVAAYVDSRDRPKHPFLDLDWPDISKKPFDHPFGPYADPFSEEQHKYGPFGPIKDFQKAKTK
ncbi:MAG: c-type cytochrome [Saprospiraceae bacterium]|nr:c-type cytochrome [Saprospiraceae bacterium]